MEKTSPAIQTLGKDERFPNKRGSSRSCNASGAGWVGKGRKNFGRLPRALASDDQVSDQHQREPETVSDPALAERHCTWCLSRWKMRFSSSTE